MKDKKNAARFNELLHFFNCMLALLENKIISKNNNKDLDVHASESEDETTISSVFVQCQHGSDVVDRWLRPLSYRCYACPDHD